MSILTKIKNWLSGKDELNINAKDKDGDGLVQEGTIFERSADLTVAGAKKTAKKAVAKTATAVSKTAAKVAKDVQKPATKKAPAKKAPAKKKK